MTRCEVSRRFELRTQQGKSLTAEQTQLFATSVHDRMTECVYAEPLRSFKIDKEPQTVYTIPVMAEGMAALEAINKARTAGGSSFPLSPSAPQRCSPAHALHPFAAPSFRRVVSTLLAFRCVVSS